MNTYIFAADIYCDDCGRAIRKRLTNKGKAPAAPANERSYDSDNFPKGPYAEHESESDTPQHCASGPKCLNAFDVGGGCMVGAWLENPLTCAGVYYVIDAIREGGDVAAFWADKYREELAAEGVNVKPKLSAAARKYLREVWGADSIVQLRPAEWTAIAENAGDSVHCLDRELLAARPNKNNSSADLTTV